MNVHRNTEVSTHCVNVRIDLSMHADNKQESKQCLSSLSLVLSRSLSLSLFVSLFSLSLFLSLSLRLRLPFNLSQRISLTLSLSVSVYLSICYHLFSRSPLVFLIRCSSLLFCHENPNS